ncbi:Tyrosine recombinase XerD [Chlamydiales bacterium STE3]|nr:Tyrosine recombinase XerD [Chlamydiales bacterium STE3]
MIEWLHEFLIYIASEKGLALSTSFAYEADLKKFILFLKDQGYQNFNAVNEQILIAYLQQLNEQKLAGSSIARNLFAIKVFFRFIKREKGMIANPAQYLSAPKLWQLIPDILAPFEIEALLQQPDLTTFEGARDVAILDFLYSCGLRVSEVCSLGVQDVDDQFVRVLGKGNKERLVPIGNKALQSLAVYEPFRDTVENKKQQRLFVSPKGKILSRNYVWRMIKTYGTRAGITKNISPHTLRHCFATHLLDNGADLRVIQEMLGHAHISSTDRYTHISRSHLQHAFEQFHPRP